MNIVEKKFAKLQFSGKQRLSFYRQMASLIRTGMSKTEAIELSWRVASDEGRRPREATALIMQDILDGMRNGLSLGRAIHEWVPAEDVMVIEATENSDDFPGYLDSYCDVVRKRANIRNVIVSGLLYPLALFLGVYGVAYYFGSEVVPQIEGILPTDQWQGLAVFLLYLQDFAEHFALPALAGLVFLVSLVLFLLPRWSRFGRSFMDRFPGFNIYRMYTGISFLIAIASLVRGGLTTMNAVERVRPMANAYVAHRLGLIRMHMLNGLNFGAALHASRTGWPDAQMNLSIKIFSETHDLSSQLHRISLDWLDRTRENIEKAMAFFRISVLFIVFLVSIGIVAGMYDLQNQVANSLQSGV